MKALFLLIAAFLLALVVIYFFDDALNYAQAGRLALSVMLLFTGIAHFTKTKEMALMLPKTIPFRYFIILLTGVFEIAAAVGLLIPQTIIVTGWSLILFFITILPANIYAALTTETRKRTEFAGQGPKYLWFRIPLQLFFMLWTYVFAIGGINWLYD